jgi:hypothetical protein
MHYKPVTEEEYAPYELRNYGKTATSVQSVFYFLASGLRMSSEKQEAAG